jgi:hypothetical protein
MGDRKALIALDFDGVVADTNAVKARWIREHLNLEVDPLRCNRTQCVPLIGEDAYRHLSDAVYSRRLTQSTPPMIGLSAALRTLSSRFGFIILTARRALSVKAAEEWLVLQDVRDYFDQMLSSEGQAKIDLAGAMDAIALVDDDVRHLRDNRHVEIRRYLFRSPIDDPVPENVQIIRVASWSDMVQSLS